MGQGATEPSVFHECMQYLSNTENAWEHAIANGAMLPARRPKTKMNEYVSATTYRFGRMATDSRADSLNPNQMQPI